MALQPPASQPRRFTLVDRKVNLHDANHSLQAASNYGYVVHMVRDFHAQDCWPIVMARSGWGFVRIWLAPLRGHLRLTPRSIDLTSVGHSAYRVAVGLPRGWDFRAVREAIVMLAMVAHVDFSAFKDLIIDCCELKCFNLLEALDEESFLPVSFQIQIVDFATEWTVDDVTALFAGLDEPPSSSFTAVARKISAYSSHIVTPFNPLDIMVAISIENRDGGVGGIVENLQLELLTIRNKHGGWRIPIAMSSNPDDPTVIPCALCIGPIQLAVPGNSLEPDDPDKIGKAMSGERRLPVNDILICTSIDNDGTIDGAVEAQMLGELYQRIFCTSENIDTWPTIDSFIATFVQDIPTSLGRLASILVEARSTYSTGIVVDFGTDMSAPDPKVWEYIAYSFFTKQASERSAVSTLDLSCGRLDLRGADAFAAVLTSPEPTSYVFGPRKGTVVKPGNTRVRSETGIQSRMRLLKGTQLTLERMDPSEDIPHATATWDLQSDVDGVRILDDSLEATTKVLVPGYGVCTVPCDDLLPLDEDICPNTLLQSQGVTHLDLDDFLILDNGEPLYRILKLIGSHLTHLRLVVGMDRPLDLSRLFQICPNLKALTLSHMLIDESEFLMGFQANNMQIAELRCEFDSVSRIVQELSDNSSALARSTKRFSYKATSRDIEEEKSILSSFIAMLDCNRTMEFLELEAPENIFAQYKPDIERHHLMPIPVVAHPFPLPCRLAFLSIFGASSMMKSTKRAKSSASAGSALADLVLDRDGISLIFAFAAECVRRRVYYKKCFTS